MPPAHRPDEHQNTLANIESARGRVEIFLDELLNRALDAVQILHKKLVLIGLAFGFFHATRHDHIVKSGMGEIGDVRFLLNDFQIVAERAFPGQAALLTALLIYLL